MFNNSLFNLFCVQFVCSIVAVQLYLFRHPTTRTSNRRRIVFYKASIFLPSATNFTQCFVRCDRTTLSGAKLRVKKWWPTEYDRDHTKRFFARLLLRLTCPLEVGAKHGATLYPPFLAHPRLRVLLLSIFALTFKTNKNRMTILASKLYVS